MPTLQTRKGDAAHLTTLVQLISSAVTTVLSEYDAVGKSVPSLDSTEPGPFDTPEEQSEGLVKAVRIIEAACGQLAISVASPGHVMFNRSYGFKEPACLQVVTQAKIADLLLDKPEGLHVDVLARQSGLDSGKLCRILRLLATRHCFREVQPNVFANNRLSIKLLAKDPIWSYVGHLTDEGMKSTAYLNEALTDPVSGPSYAVEASPFYRMQGCTVFDHYASPEGQKRADRFAGAMKGLGEVNGKRMLRKVYPWGGIPDGTIICDVGGSTGHVTMDLIQTFPQLRLVIQDMPHVVDQAKEFWAQEDPSAVQNSRVAFAALDFFTEVPVAGCDFYYIRHILHDWPDAECVKILSNVRKAMKPTSRVLIHEFVLQNVARVLASENPHVDQAPEPLLPNYGMGRIRPYQQDINMMGFLNSKERTVDEFISLGVQSGLKFAKLWDAGETGLVELVLA
ncbi:S-adenosyl-L-methionine-dependent methyltransferase [Pleurotus eryngii]|uniref:S-adenosyl-L-methionine-dependent methyltransferase n=1 Tax=Pleurotus eryngii TaxID=5323 RepID=A0A9P6A0P7_PLEER|nr:S-adenosyl-L-methionine-dependent methyltransferase [Pleurotus eryngii]